MKRILIYSTAYLPLVGGAEVAIKETTDRLSDYEFDLVTARIRTDLPAREQIARVNVHRLGWGNRFDKYLLAFYGGWYGSHLHRQQNYTAVWAIMASFGGFAALHFKQKNSAVPYLLSLQEGDDLQEVEKKSGFLHQRWLAIFRQADLIQTISQYLADWAERLGAQCPIQVIPNGVDAQKFYRGGGQTWGENDKVVITTSRLVPKNAVADIVSALVYLPVEVKLWILGVGPEEERLKKLAADHRLSDRVIFFGLVPNEDLPVYLSKAAVFVRPSLSEGLGNSFLEAMAAGLPTIGTPVGGIPDFLCDGETGWLVPVGNPHMIAEKVAFILNPSNRPAVVRVIKQAKTLITDRYDWQGIALQMGRIFETITVHE